MQQIAGYSSLTYACIMNCPHHLFICDAQNSLIRDADDLMLPLSGVIVSKFWEKFLPFAAMEMIYWRKCVGV